MELLFALIPVVIIGAIVVLPVYVIGKEMNKSSKKKEEGDE